MKQEVYTNGQKTSSTPVPATRYRPTPKTKENPTTDSPHRVRPKSVTPITATSNTTRRSINFNRVRPVPVVPVLVPVSTEEDKCKELQKRLDLSENTVKELQRRVEASDNSVKELQGEVSELRAHCQRLNGVNSELEAHKKRLEGELTAAKEKIRQLEINAQVVQFFFFVNDLEKKLHLGLYMISIRSIFLYYMIHFFFVKEIILPSFLFKYIIPFSEFFYQPFCFIQFKL